MSKKPIGFAAMSKKEQRALAVMGGKSVPAELRSFSQDNQLAARAGSAGGKASVEARRRRKLESQEQ